MLPRYNMVIFGGVDGHVFCALWMDNGVMCSWIIHVLPSPSETVGVESDQSKDGHISYCLFHPRLQSLKSELDERASWAVANLHLCTRSRNGPSRGCFSVRGYCYVCARVLKLIKRHVDESQRNCHICYVLDLDPLRGTRETTLQLTSVFSLKNTQCLSLNNH